MGYGGASSRDGSIRLIVNADDLGRTAKINEGIENAFRNGIVSSTSLVANSPAFDHALKVIRENPSLGIGIHLTLTEYPPITKSRYLQSLARRGMISALVSLIYATSAHLRLVEQEFRRQIEKALSHNIPLSHLDGHNHIHIHPRLAGVILRLMRDYSLRYIRLPRESLAHRKGWGRFIQKSILVLVCGVDTFLLRPTIRWPDAFHGFTEGGNLRREDMVDIFRHLRPGINELMCHVGMENDDLPFSIGYHWLDELRAVTSFTKKQLQTKYGIQVISYREI